MQFRRASEVVGADHFSGTGASRYDRGDRGAAWRCLSISGLRFEWQFAVGAVIANAARCGARYRVLCDPGIGVPISPVSRRC